ncbi:hypothetical protein N0V83_008488 [Neocucurbitaria cava]|uniref:Aminoglycoside phosphotransferase domain-containing protein n=1 Tax=Neocucurbitaria cava TaxID=798079 RepID=A0A9W8Y597_9PLEO|nr:hypothetical protein N0V83_008488 [Neocucurbitaria cava]
MSRGTYAARPARPSSTVSSSSSSSASSRTHSATPDFPSIQKLIRSVYRSSKITVQQAEQLQARLHQVFLTRMVDGSILVLKCPPACNTRLLRHEKSLLENESKALETLHNYLPRVPVPQLLKYDGQGTSLGSPYIMMSYIPGRRLSELAPYLTAAERSTIDQTLGAYVRALTTPPATQFGMTHRVFARKGSDSWHEAFSALFEAVLRDAEDMLVTIPYESIRYYVGKQAHFLNEVTEPRFVALHACDPTNVLIDETTKRVTGLVGFSDVIWGDPLMTGGLEGGSAAFFEGYGSRPVQTGGVKARMLMYAAYKATLRIVTHHYRPHLGTDENEARRELSIALNALAAM